LPKFGRTNPFQNFITGLCMHCSSVLIKLDPLL
jgi:hypothetical protein